MTKAKQLPLSSARLAFLRGSVLSAAVFGVAALLAGCKANSDPIVATSPSAAPAPPPADTRLIIGGGCSGEISRFQTILKADVDTGNVNQSVYDAIQRELAPATSACASGRDGEARAMVQATKAKHGYRS
jgi:hypothetical protein